jgi:hypothetical protein
MDTLRNDGLDGTGNHRVRVETSPKVTDRNGQLVKEHTS